MQSLDRLTFAWWNLHDFAHYDPNRSVLSRRLKKLVDYEAKRDRILATIQELTESECPDLLELCEITREAARDLTERLPADFDLAVSSPGSSGDDFRVMVIYRKTISLTTEDILILAATADVSRGTRPMIPIHLMLPGHVVRFIACHWTGLDEDSSPEARDQLANFLRRNVYDFLHPNPPTVALARQVVLLGDLHSGPRNPDHQLSYP